MRRSAKIFIFALLLIVSCSSATADETDAAEDNRLSNLIKKIKPSIVAVGTYYFNDVPKAAYLGTGFIIDNGKRLVTNYHVVQPILEKKKTAYLRIFHVNFPDTGIKAGILAVDEFHDLAILEHESEPLPSLTLGESTLVREGHGVIFTGYPVGLVFGLNPTTHSGIISGIAPLIKPSPSARIIDGDLIRHLNKPYDILQIDASVLSEPTGITYAIPSDFIKALKKSIP